MSDDYAIETEGLTKIFRSRFPSREFKAVDSISLRVLHGTTFGLLGPNGAGKTTLVKMILSATHPTAGRARFFGRDSRDADARRPVGYLPENHRFPTYMTGTGMLEFYGALSGMEPAARKKRIPELLDLVGLDKWGTTRLGKYSKGMLQRIGLAQALIHSPRILILDEPADGVDAMGRRQIWDILHALEEKGVTILLNSHLLADVEQFCKEVAIMARGRVVLEGPVKELIAGSGYSIEPAEMPEALQTELRSAARSVIQNDGVRQFVFSDRADANRAIDLLRRERVEVEGVHRTTSTLEDVFVRTINAQ